MGDIIKRVLLAALVAAAGFKGYQYWKGGSVTHQVTFRAEGPNSCHVQVHYGTGDAPAADTTTLEWAQGPVETRGHAHATLSVDFPLSCGWQPEQVRCFIDRDGAPWKEAVARRVTDPTDGTPRSMRCEVEGRVTE